jgi:hypothetical protein
MESRSPDFYDPVAAPDARNRAIRFVGAAVARQQVGMHTGGGQA